MYACIRGQNRSSDWHCPHKQKCIFHWSFFLLLQMPKPRVKKSDRTKWSVENLNAAKRLREQGISIRTAAKRCEIPFSIIQELRKKNMSLLFWEEKLFSLRNKRWKWKNKQNI